MGSESRDLFSFFPSQKVAQQVYYGKKSPYEEETIALGRWWERKPFYLIQSILLALLLPAEQSALLEELLLLLKDHSHTQSQSQEDSLFGTGQSDTQWSTINRKLNIQVQSMPQLLQALALNKFGPNMRVGDLMCGSGSMILAAHQLGLECVASDLNPLAALLTYSGFVLDSRQGTFFAELRQGVWQSLEGLGLEDRKVQRYHYTGFVFCAHCQKESPLISAPVLQEKEHIILELSSTGYRIRTRVGEKEWEELKKGATLRESIFHCPYCGEQMPLDLIRREMKNKGQAFVQKLLLTEDQNGQFALADSRMLDLDARLHSYVEENLGQWLAQKLVPDLCITEEHSARRFQKELEVEYFYQFFPARQILYNVLWQQAVRLKDRTREEAAFALLWMNQMLNLNSRLAHPIQQESFYTPNYNKTYHYVTQGFGLLMKQLLPKELKLTPVDSKFSVQTLDALESSEKADIWLVDPLFDSHIQYADLSDFFLSWDKALLQEHFPQWHTDSRRTMALENSHKLILERWIAIFTHAKEHLSAQGYIILFLRRQNSDTWEDLTFTLWQCGLALKTALMIDTEQEGGNRGEAVLILQKQESVKKGFFDEIHPEIIVALQNFFVQEQRQNQLQTNASLLFAANIITLQILTDYTHIEGWDVAYELSKLMEKQSHSPIYKIYQEALKTAYSLLSPANFNVVYWKRLNHFEKFMLKVLEQEGKGNNRNQSVQKLAKAFGIKDYLSYFTRNAQEVSLKNPFALLALNQKDEVLSTLFNALFLLLQKLKTEETITAVNWNQLLQDKNMSLELLHYLERLEHVRYLADWKQASLLAKILRAKLEAK
jgi:adenine-specific DNA methylase